MGRVILNLSMSLDGYAAGPDVSLSSPLGEGGDRLHEWLFADGGRPATAVDREVEDRIWAAAGAFVMGRRTFDVGEGPWGEDGTFGRPCFVVTHRPRERLVKGPTTFTFVTDGVDVAVAEARQAAGDRDVVVMSPDLAQQCLNRGLLEELHLHLVPVLLGAGTRLFDSIGLTDISLERLAIRESPYVTHLAFRLL